MTDTRPALPLVAILLAAALAGCTETPATDRTSERRSPSVTQSTTAVRTDHGPIAKRFPKLGAFRDTHWQATTTIVADDRVPGPDETSINAVVTLAPEELAAATSGYRWEPAPTAWANKVPAPLRPFAPSSGDWRYSEQYDTEVRTTSGNTGYNGTVYLDLASGTVFLSAY